jgi:Uma2 family endonuclease
MPAFISIEDYLAGEELAETKHEFLGGTVHAMAGGTNDHAAVAANALIALGSRLRGKPCRPFGSDTKVRIELPDHTRFYYPDVQVVCNRNPGTERFKENPVVVIEVLSESTRRTDLGEKRSAYLAIPALKVLLLVEPDCLRVTAYRRQPQGGFAAEAYEGTEAVIALPELEAELPLAELYEGTAQAGELS